MQEQGLPIPEAARRHLIDPGDEVFMGYWRAKAFPTRAQLKSIRRLERKLGAASCSPGTRAEATAYLTHLHSEINRAAAKAERAHHPHQWQLPAASTQLFQLRRAGIKIERQLTRREANELLRQYDQRVKGSR